MKHLICLAGLLAAMIAPALADQRLQATVAVQNSPIELESCGAALSDTNVGNYDYYLNEAVRFKNRSDKDVTAVRFGFDVMDSFGQKVRTVTGDDAGLFSPGVEINPTPTNGAWSTINVNPSIASVTCWVELVRFEDGSVWQSPALTAGL